MDGQQTSGRKNWWHNAAFLRSVLYSLGSLQLTVVCLALACVLVFVGTLAQVRIGIYEAQRQYFMSLFVLLRVPGTSFAVPVFPGGYLIGLILLVNLVASFWRYPGLRRELGLILTHLGIAIMLIGQVVSDFTRVESSLRLEEGEAKNYSEDDRHFELALVDRSLPDRDRIYAVPQSWLRAGRFIEDPRLPVKIRVIRFWSNSRLQRLTAGSTNRNELQADQGIGRMLTVESLPVETRSDRRNMPSALIELLTPEGESLGRWLVSAWLEEQPVRLDGRQLAISLRLRRYYKPYTIQLIDFEHVTYPGSDIPKSFSSRVRLIDPEHRVDREVLIYMNHPLRYRGETFYQAGYDPRNDRVTILQVVRNPAWVSPYISCGIVTLGLLIHFGRKAFRRGP